jgi:hypothetical protein
MYVIGAIFNIYNSNFQNVLDTVPVEYRQIKTVDGDASGEYVTDTGLVVPAIPLQGPILRNSISTEKFTDNLLL